MIYQSRKQMTYAIKICIFLLRGNTENGRNRSGLKSHNPLYGSERNIKHNLFLFFIDGIAFTPAMTLISITTVIPYFLTHLGASNFQIALAISIPLICNFVGQPFFGFVATHSRVMNKTFGNILLLQRLIFLGFVLCIPLFARTGTIFVWIFLFCWSVFNFFVGSYGVFYTPLMLNLLPPDKRGVIRGMGDAVGSGLGLAVAALIPLLLGRFAFPVNYTLIFSFGSLFLIMDAIIFYFMRQHEHVTPNLPMSIVQYLREMPFSIRTNVPFRAFILTSMFLVAANSLLPYYTLYAIRVFKATESHIAIFAGLAVISNAVGYIVFGAITDRRGPNKTMILAAIFVLLAGAIALSTKSLGMLFVAWALANIGNTGYSLTSSILLGAVSPLTKLPLYVGVQTTISLALSSAVLLLLAPIMESIGYVLLFATVFACGLFSLLINLFILQKQLAHISVR